MALGLCFYILMLIWIFFGWRAYPTFEARMPSLLLFCLLLLLGWKVFGPPLHG